MTKLHFDPVPLDPETRALAICLQADKPRSYRCRLPDGTLFVSGTILNGHWSVIGSIEPPHRLPSDKEMRQALTLWPDHEFKEARMETRFGGRRYVSEQLVK